MTTPTPSQELSQDTSECKLVSVILAVVREFNIVYNITLSDMETNDCWHD